MSDEQTLLSNADGTIVSHGPLVLVSVCEGAALELAVRLIATFALVASTIISILVGVRAAPWPILLISITWTIGATAAHVLTLRQRRKHGRVSVDFERGEIQHEGAGFRATYPLERLDAASTQVVWGADDESEPGFAPRWLVLHLKRGVELRLGRGPGYALRPAIAFLRKAGVEVRSGQAR